MDEIVRQDNSTGLEIAVIGMAGRFPGAANIDEFWNNLEKGVESISFFSDGELEEAGIEPGELKAANYVKARGILEDVEYFDAAFFGYIPEEAKKMIPQSCIFHECAWEALENAGYAPDSYDGAIGLFAGASSSFFWEGLHLLSGSPGDADRFNAALLGDKDFMCTLVSYRLDLKGPVFGVQTACSTSLVAIHLACRALLTGDCDIALAGGVSVLLPHKTGYPYQEGMIKSPDGHCRAFDAAANGTVGGEGAGIVVLKTLEDAIAHRDFIHAVIKSSAVNNDGRRKAGFTAPGVNGQASVIKTALRLGQVTPESIGYIETHGTGTSLGDPVEIEALKLAFATNKKRFCALGSVKTNVGHLDAATGVAGFIKTVLALKHQLIPPSLHFTTANPRIDFENSPFYVVTKPTTWNPVSRNHPLRAGVSSFGIGGTNAHLVLEQAPMDNIPGRESDQRKYQLILLSAKTGSALKRITENFVLYLKKNPDINLADAAYTLQVGRKVLEHQKMLVVSSAAETIALLTSSEPDEVATFVSKVETSPVIFMFPGQGSQYVNMCLELYRTEEAFRQDMDRCFEILEPIMGYDIKKILYPSITSNSAYMPNIFDFTRTEVAQPVLFVLEYALAKLLMKWGIKPRALIGHSIGEYTAACLSGVFSLEDALKLVALRGKLMQQMSGGSMVSVSLSEEKITPLLNGNKQLSLAAVNSTCHCVVSGPDDAVEGFETQLAKTGYKTRRLHTSHAFHSRMMEPILKTFAEEVSRVRANEPVIPFISNVTGRWITPAEAVDPQYWASHLRLTVRFSNGLEELLNEEPGIFVEVGPGNVLSTFVRQHADKKPGQQVINLVRHPQEQVSDSCFLLKKIGWLRLYGTKPDWQAFHSPGQRHRIPLPAYPFEGRRYWDPAHSLKNETAKLLKKSLFRKKPDMADWFYLPLWEQSIPAVPQPVAAIEKARWILFIDTYGLGSLVKERLRLDNREVISVSSGCAFKKINNSEYIINPSRAGDYETLFNEFRQIQKIPYHILHFWSITGNTGKEPGVEEMDNLQDLTLYSLLYMAQAIGSCGITDNIRLVVVSDNMQKVTGEEALSPWKATLVGAVKIIPLEYANMNCRSIDIVLPQAGSPKEARLIDYLLAEFTIDTPGKVAAYRGDFRWLQTVKPIRLEKSPIPNPRLRDKGVYLITGGLGGMGFTLAEHLAKCVKARLILVGRSTFPARNEWNRWLASHPQENDISLKVQKIRELEELGAEVMICSADIANPEQMQAVAARAWARFGPIHGVLHTAGIIDDAGVIQKRTRQMTERVMAPKVKGLLVLNHILKDTPLDFLVLFSSLGNHIYGIKFGQVAYNAANEFLDAFAYYHTSEKGIFTAAINWTDWLEKGMSIKALDRKFKGKKEKPDYAALLQGALTPSQGVDVFNRILAGSLPHVAVSTHDLPMMLEQMHSQKDEDLSSFKLSLETGDDHALHTTLHTRPQLSTIYVEPQNHIERNLAALWARFFGIRQVGTRDDFFELGGDSLKAMSVLSDIHKQTNIKIPLARFFNKPHIQGLAQYINRAEQEKYHHLEKAEEKEYYSLSSAQKRLFIVQQLDLKSTAYNMTTVLEVEGEPDRAKIKRTFETLIARHESFRTSFHMIKSEPAQKIHDKNNVEFEIEYYDSGEEQWATGIHHSYVRPFDLAQAPLLRVGLINVSVRGATFHILIADMHHIITDGASLGIIAKEFSTIYEGKSLAGLPIRYRDYLEWQESPKQKERIRSQEEYWVKQFETGAPILDLPCDYARPAVQSFQGSSLSFEIGIEQSIALKKTVPGEEITMFMVLLAVLNILFSRISRQNPGDIVIGTAIEGRNHPDLQQAVGMFVNTLALRNYPEGEKTFGAFAREVRDRTLEAFENQDYPFELLVENVSVRRDAARNPLFDVMFTFQNIKGPEIGITGLTFKPYERETRSANFDIFLQAFETDGRLTFKMGYCTRLFKGETMERMARYFKALVSSVLQNPGKQVSEIEIIPEQEKRLMLFEFNRTEADYPKDKSIHMLFEEQAEKNPDSTAVIGTAQSAWFIAFNQPGSLTHQPSGHCALRCTLSYSELNKRSNQLAFLLMQKGIKPGTNPIVSIMASRSVEMMIGLLGILKAGGAYLPIDPDYPAQRIKYMLAHSNARVLVSEESEVNKVSEVSEVSEVNKEIEIILLDKEIKNFISHPVQPSYPLPAQRLNHPATRLNLAYVIYTSGSTGNPKGVMVPHRNAVNFIKGMTGEIAFSPGKTILALTSISFDIFFLETLLPVTCGMKVVIADENQQKDPGLLEKVISEDHVNMVQMTPSRLQLLLNWDSDLSGLAGVEALLVGGEAFPIQLFAGVKKRFRGKIYNLYGPTETTIWSALKDLSQSKPQELTIGQPIANTRIYIVDRYTGLLPLGAVGELLIGGDGVAKGYLNNPEMTAEKFEHDLWSYQDYQGKKRKKSPSPCSPYSPIYRTGDLARWLADGEIECLGRIDLQVKIRGFRVELAEIERQLLTHEHITEAVAVMKTNKRHEKYLCAYFVPDGTGGDDLRVSKLREMLSVKLPHYMIPSYFVSLEKIPLTPNGKIDRKALPDPDPTCLDYSATYAAPETDNEKIIATLWKEVLHVENVNIHDNFFDLGGNSLNVIQLNWKLKETFGVDIPVAVMYRNLSIVFLDRYVSQYEKRSDKTSEEESKRMQALNKARKTIKATINKLTANRRMK